MAQVATLPSLTVSQPRNARNYKGEKFLVNQLKLVVVRDPSTALAMGCPIGELAELCIWTGRSTNASRHYASLWVYSLPYFMSGYGVAQGSGYCRASAAAGAAFLSAGITLQDPISGAGMHTVQNAMLALGAAMGHCRKKMQIIWGA
jgi:hypothetical protein